MKLLGRQVMNDVVSETKALILTPVSRDTGGAAARPGFRRLSMLSVILY